MLALFHARCRLVQRHLQGVGGQVEVVMEEESTDERREEEGMEELGW